MLLCTQTKHPLFLTQLQSIVIFLVVFVDEQANYFTSLCTPDMSCERHECPLLVYYFRKTFPLRSLIISVLNGLILREENGKKMLAGHAFHSQFLGSVMLACGVTPARVFCFAVVALGASICFVSLLVAPPLNKVR